MKFNLKIAQINQEDLGIGGVILLALQSLINRKKKEIIFIECKNISYTNKLNVWDKFFIQPFIEFEDLIKKKINNKDYIKEKIEIKKDFLFNWVGKDINLIKKSNLIKPYKKIFYKHIKFNRIIINKFLEIEKRKLKEKTLSVHLRGTDRFNKNYHFANQRKNFELFKIKSRIEKKLNELDIKKIFLATDDLEYKNFMINSFKKKSVIFNNSIYGKKDGIHHNFWESDSFKTKIAEEALLDIMLMARCNYSFLSTSNISLISILMRRNNKYSFLDSDLKSK